MEVCPKCEGRQWRVRPAAADEVCDSIVTCECYQPVTGLSGSTPAVTGSVTGTLLGHPDQVIRTATPFVPSPAARPSALERIADALEGLLAHAETQTEARVRMAELLERLLAEGSFGLALVEDDEDEEDAEPWRRAG